MVSCTVSSSAMFALAFSMLTLVHCAKPSLKNRIAGDQNPVSDSDKSNSVRHERSVQGEGIETDKRLLDKIGHGLVKRKNDVIQRILPKLEYYLVQSFANKAYEDEQNEELSKRGFDKIGMGLIKRRMDRIGMGLIKKKAFDKLGFGLIKKRAFDKLGMGLIKKTPFDKLGMGLIRKRPLDSDLLGLYKPFSRSGSMRPPQPDLDALESGSINRFNDLNNGQWGEKRFFDKMGSGLIKKLDQDASLSDNELGADDSEDYNKRFFDPLGSGLIR